MENRFRSLGALVVIFALILDFSFAGEVKESSAAGTFYPDDPAELSAMVEGFMALAGPDKQDEKVFALILPHAGYGFSGETAADGYRLIKDKNYKTIVIIGTSHNYGFNGISIYEKGEFFTPLGKIEVDSDFSRQLLGQSEAIYFEPKAFEKEHSIEVQLPFLQKALDDFKIVPIITGDCSLDTCKKLAFLLKGAIGERKDVLVIVSTDFYHGYDYEEALKIDNLTLSCIKSLDADGLYYGLRDGRLQLCGGFGVVSLMVLSKELGLDQANLLKRTDSAEVTGKKVKRSWTVGYASLSINQRDACLTAGRERVMLNNEERKKLLGIARKSIEVYLRTGKKLELQEDNPLLKKDMGVFVTLNKNKELRGCIGNLIAKSPLYLAVREMAVEAAISDPRFPPVALGELKDIDIEISVLSPMQKIDNPDKIRLGVDGVLVRKGFRSGVFLPQVATETGWSKEEFLSNLCSHKAGLLPDAWKDKDTEILTFTAEIFSEKDL
jgi:AmmeMemoRadiSam system protein B/AmmeMemoRadiSam system protein A